MRAGESRRDSHQCAIEPKTLVRRIVDEYGARIRGYLRRIGGRRETAMAFDDVLSDSFLACDGMASGADLWPPILSALRAYGAGWKRQEHHERSMLDYAHSNDDMPAMENHERRAALWEWEETLLRLLPKEQRYALEWHVMDNMDDAAIAAGLNVPIGRVRVLRHRASLKCRHAVASGRILPPPVD